MVFFRILFVCAVEAVRADVKIHSHVASRKLRRQMLCFLSNLMLRNRIFFSLQEVWFGAAVLLPRWETVDLWNHWVYTRCTVTEIGCDNEEKGGKKV